MMDVREHLSGRGSEDDIYLSPHSDDVCFSLGAFASRRRAGVLLTVFSVSDYRTGKPDPEVVRAGGSRPGSLRAGEAGVLATTLVRMTEDEAFAGRCGLQPQWLRLKDAQARGQAPFGASDAREIARSLEQPLMRALLAPTVGRKAEPRPWLFCPAGIGGHVDHVAVLMLVASQIDALEKHYRIAFYEDLPYASNPSTRDAAWQLLRQSVQPRELERCRFDLPDASAQALKMALVNLHPSQLTARLRSIAAFTPATGDSPSPHEALWVLQDRHQRPG
ncbi:MAG: hypothetical protein V4669_10350 [Pseudomonadota bacterium]